MIGPGNVGMNWNLGELERPAEQALVNHGPGAIDVQSQRNVMLASIAVSLKRIADALEKASKPPFLSGPADPG